MLIFKYIEDKDVFQTFYSKMLAKRLIHGNPFNSYLESQTISRLKQICGHEYTTKLARMFNDMAFSQELLTKYQESPQYEDYGFNFQVLILATGSWPISPSSTTFNIPPILLSPLISFEKFYTHKDQNPSHKLIWLMQFSKGVIRTTYLEDKSYTFESSAYQMGILLLFNDKDTLTVDDVQEATGLPDAQLKTTLWSLIKLKVLLTSPKNSKTITKKNKFKLNPQYTNKKKKVLINVTVRELTNKPEGEQQDNNQNSKIIEEDRKIHIQAAIIRIMKTRSQLNHVQLIGAVVDMLKGRFKPKIPLVKKCIDMLLERGYLSRVEGERDTFRYVA